MVPEKHIGFMRAYTFDRTYQFLFSIEELNITDVLVFTIIYNYNLTTPECFIGQETISKKLNVTSRTVRNSLSRLEKIGLLNVVHRNGYTNIYEANYERLEEFACKYDKGLCLTEEKISEGVRKKFPRGQEKISGEGRKKFPRGSGKNFRGDRKNFPTSIPYNISDYNIRNNIPDCSNCSTNSGVITDNRPCLINKTTTTVTTDIEQNSNKENDLVKDNSSRGSRYKGNVSLRDTLPEVSVLSEELNKKENSDTYGNQKRSYNSYMLELKYNSEERSRLSQYLKEAQIKGIGNGLEQGLVRRLAGKFCYMFSRAEIEMILGFIKNDDLDGILQQLSVFVTCNPNKLISDKFVDVLDEMGYPADRSKMGKRFNREINWDAA